MHEISIRLKDFPSWRGAGLPRSARASGFVPKNILMEMQWGQCTLTGMSAGLWVGWGHRTLQSHSVRREVMARVAAGSHYRTTAAQPGSRAAWPCRAPTSAPAMLTTTTASASVPRCCQEVSSKVRAGVLAPCPSRCHPPAPSHRVVVRRLRALQPEWHLLPGTAQHPQAERHPLALLPGAQLLTEGHPHADTARGLLAGRSGAAGGRSPRRASPHYFFLTLVSLRSQS